MGAMRNGAGEIETKGITLTEVNEIVHITDAKTHLFAAPWDVYEELRAKFPVSDSETRFLQR